MSVDMQSPYPTSREALLEAIQQEWDALMALVNRLPTPLLDEPGPGGWSPKDNLAHLYDWENFMLGHYLRGLSPSAALNLEDGALDGLSEDQENELLYQRSKGRLAGDVIELLKLTHESVLDELRQVPFEKLMQPRPPGGRPLIAYLLANTVEHYAEHRATIESMLRM